LNDGLPKPLRFSNLDDVTERLDLLLRMGYTKTGQWNLAQICEHLNDWFRYMIDGYPRFKFPLSWIAWSIRVTLGRSMLQKILRNGQMQRSGATVPETVHRAEGLSDADSVNRLKETIQRFRQHKGPYCDSPIFGKLPADNGMKLQLIHCAHHLGFLIPKGDSKSC
jgi:hypothetical protein